jgi:very-short-patch-repair endonuclease
MVNGKYWSREEMIDIAKQYYHKYGKKHKKDFKTYRKKNKLCSYERIKLVFGSLNQYYKESNIHFITDLPKDHIPKKLRYKKRILRSVDDDISMCKDFFKKHPISKKIDFIKYLRNTKIVHPTTIRKKYGSFEHLASLSNNKFYTELDYVKYYLIKKLKDGYHDGSIKYKTDIYKKLKITSPRLTRYFGSVDNFIKLANVELVRKQRKELKFNPVGKNEKLILDLLEKVLKVKLTRQKAVYTYFVDGYDEENNTVYEVDEYHHKFRKNYDIKREKTIKKILNCKFVRINEKQFMKDIAEVC